MALGKQDIALDAGKGGFRATEYQNAAGVAITFEGLQADAVTDLAGTLTGSTDGTITNVAAIALSTSDTYTDAAVNTAVNTAITSLNLQLKELQVKLNELLGSLRTAGVIDT